MELSVGEDRSESLALFGGVFLGEEHMGTFLTPLIPANAGISVNTSG